MSVFICWSGDRSHALAKRLETLLHDTLRSLGPDDVFVSDDIDKGATWFESLEDRLEEAAAGIVCLTAENLNSPWMHFEAGALARRLSSRDQKRHASSKKPKPRNDATRLFPLLMGVSGAQLQGPLGAYQGTNVTQADLGRMIKSIGSVLGHEPIRLNRKRNTIIRDSVWKKFERDIGEIAVPAHELIPSLERLFQRKTFTEAIHHCTDQTWLRRCDGARETRARLARYLKRVRAACPPHEHALFDMLLSELDGYAMAMESLLVEPLKFKMSKPGELAMPPATLTSCEARRLAIRSLSARLVHATDEPQVEPAARFMAAETNEERKMIIHRLEGAIRREAEGVFVKTAGRKHALKLAIGKLTKQKVPIKYRASSWDLDRIYYYLLVQYFRSAALNWTPGAASLDSDAQPEEYEWICAARDVEMEVERYRAKSKGASLMPLTYALCALQELHPRQATKLKTVQSAVKSALDVVENELPRELESDAGRPILDLVANLRSPADRSRRRRRTRVAVRRRSAVRLRSRRGARARNRKP